MRLRSSSLVCLVALALCGCGALRSLTGSRVELETLGVSVEKPANVAVFLTARTGDQPLAELDDGAFLIYEDGQLVDPSVSQQTLLGGATVADYRTHLLVDMSGTAGEGTGRQAAAHAVAAFVEKVTESEAVAVYAFAGDEKPTLIGDYPRGRYANSIDVEVALQSFSPRDSSRDLANALIQGTKELENRLTQLKKPLRIGTLVLFARGPDLARRVEEQQITETLERAKHQVVVIGVGDSSYLDRWGHSGVLHAQSADDLGPVFEEAASLLLRLEWSHYLLSYCSPSRSGRRTLRIEVVATTQDGEKKGSVQEEFDAAGFGPGCNAKTPPRRFSPGAAERERIERGQAWKAGGTKVEPASQASPKRSPDASPKGDAQKPPAEIVPPPNTSDYAH